MHPNVASCFGFLNSPPPTLKHLVYRQNPYRHLTIGEKGNVLIFGGAHNLWEPDFCTRGKNFAFYHLFLEWSVGWASLRGPWLLPYKLRKCHITTAFFPFKTLFRKYQTPLIIMVSYFYVEINSFFQKKWSNGALKMLSEVVISSW